MKLTDFFEEIAMGELYDLAFAKNGEILDDKKPLVTIKLNDVLTNLHNKYILQLREDVIDTSVKQNWYMYDNDNSVQIVYLEPMSWDDTTIYKHKDMLSIRGNSLHFLKPPNENAYRITYHWKPDRLQINPAKSGFDKQVVSIPDTLIPLVRTQVASAIFMNMNNELQKKTGVELANLAQFMIVDLETMGILNTAVDYENRQFLKNGFK